MAGNGARIGGDASMITGRPRTGWCRGSGQGTTQLLEPSGDRVQGRIRTGPRPKPVTEGHPSEADVEHRVQASMRTNDPR